MPFYVSPEQSMRDKADYARKGIARGRSCVALKYADGILLVAPNPSSALHKISEIYDRIGFAAVGRYNEYENLRKAGVTYADITGYQFDRHAVTARAIANWYAQTLGTIFTESNKPFEAEIVAAEEGARPGDNQIYRSALRGPLTDPPARPAFGRPADRVPAARGSRPQRTAPHCAPGTPGSAALPPAPPPRSAGRRLGPGGAPAPAPL